jgi:hypothetical protein
MRTNIGHVYLLITTEFKKTEQKLGKLEEFSKEVAKKINEIDENLLAFAEQFSKYTEEYLEKCSVNVNNEDNFIVEIKNFNIKMNNISNDIIKIIENIKYKLNIDSFEKLYCFIKKRDNYDVLLKKLGKIKFDNLNSKFYEFLSLEIQNDFQKQMIKLYKEERKEIAKLLQTKMEEKKIINYNINNYYDDIIIKGSEFRAIIVNHHIIYEPYLHYIYTVMRYDLVKKKLYFDLLITNKQYVKSNSLRLKEFIPRMFDEHSEKNEFIENYAKNIYEIVKSDVSNTNLIFRKVSNINKYINRESKEKIVFSKEKINISLQKNMVEYLSGKTPIDDNQTKVKLCDLKTLPYFYLDTNYNYVISNTKRIVAEKKILANKSYTVIATSIALLRQNIIFEKQGEEDNHAEALLIKANCKNEYHMEQFKSNDMIYIIRLYHNGNIGCGLPCNRCVRVLHGNGINRVIYSMDDKHYRIIDMDEMTYTYTTTGNKLLNTDTYLYENYIIPKRIRN